jgi:hypothetical protein
MRRILPFAVILKRLCAPRCVFNFFLGFSELRGIALNPFGALMRAVYTRLLHLEFVAEALSAKETNLA